MDKVLGAYLYTKSRLAEPSTHASLSALFMTAGVNINSGIVHDIVVLIGVAFGAAGFFVKEAKPLTEVD